jgi:hypothetical protein
VCVFVCACVRVSGVSHEVRPLVQTWLGRPHSFCIDESLCGPSFIHRAQITNSIACSTAATVPPSLLAALPPTPTAPPAAARGLSLRGRTGTWPSSTMRPWPAGPRGGAAAAARVVAVRLAPALGFQILLSWRWPKTWGRRPACWALRMTTTGTLARLTPRATPERASHL